MWYLSFSLYYLKTCSDVGLYGFRTFKEELMVYRVPLDVAIAKLLSSGANVPVVYAGKVIEDAGKWFNGAGNWFGDRAADYSKVLGNTANTIGDSLSAGGQEIYSAMASEFNKLSKDFLSTASKIEDALKDPLGGFLGLGEGIANLDSLIGEALSGAESTLNTVLNSLNSAGNDIKDWFTGNFILTKLPQSCFFFFFLFNVAEIIRCALFPIYCFKYRPSSSVVDTILPGVCGFFVGIPWFPHQSQNKHQVRCKTNTCISDFQKIN